MKNMNLDFKYSLNLKFAYGFIMCRLTALQGLG